MKDGRSVLAVIPARGGSKGLPRKNLKSIAGKSLVRHAVETALSLGWIDAVVVSTDDEEIRQEGLDAGASVPFLRPEELAGDKASSVDTWRHAWLESEKHFGRIFDISILLEPTSPFRTREDIERTLEPLFEGNCAAAATVSRTPAHYTPHKTLLVNETGRIGFYHPQGASFAIRQRIPSYYHRNGICYAVLRKTLVDDGFIIENDCLAIIIERTVVNIDDAADLQYARYLLEHAACGADADE